MSRKYDDLETVAKDTYQRSERKGNGSDDGSTADATRMYWAISRERFFIDPEGCFIVLPIS